MRSIEKGPVHGTAVALAGRGLLILGPSGAGKSGLALTLLSMGADLVADDRVILSDRGGRVVMSAPDALADRIEARGLGILRSPTRPAPLALVADLGVPFGARLPAEEEMLVLQCRIPLIRAGDLPNLAPALRLLLTAGRSD